MTLLHYRGLVLYVWGKPVPGTRLGVIQGENSGAFAGMDDFGNALTLTPAVLDQLYPSRRPEE